MADEKDVEPQDYIEPELPEGNYRYIPPGLLPDQVDEARLSATSGTPPADVPNFYYGIGAAALGALITLISFTMETTAPYSETLNIGRLQDQMMMFQLGCTVMIGGVIAAVGLAILDHLKKPL